MIGVRGLAHMVNGSNVLTHIARRTVRQHTKTTGPGEEAKAIRKTEISLMSYCVLIALKPKFSLILT